MIGRSACPLRLLTGPEQNLILLRLLLVLQLQSLRLQHDGHEEEGRAAEHDPPHRPPQGVAGLGQRQRACQQQVRKLTWTVAYGSWNFCHFTKL